MQWISRPWCFDCHYWTVGTYESPVSLHLEGRDIRATISGVREVTRYLAHPDLDASTKQTAKFQGRSHVRTGVNVICSTDIWLSRLNDCNLVPTFDIGQKSFPHTLRKKKFTCITDFAQQHLKAEKIKSGFREGRKTVV